jgi:hypothetical protein
VLQRVRLQLDRWGVVDHQPPVIAAPAIGFPRDLMPLGSMGDTYPLGFPAFRATAFLRHSGARSKEFAGSIFGGNRDQMSVLAEWSGIGRRSDFPQPNSAMDKDDG